MILWCLLDLGAKPTCYVFYLENLESADLLCSRRVCEHYDLPLQEVVIRRDIEQLEQDVRYIITRFRTARKTAVQCLYPILHIFPAIAEHQVFSGLNADDWFGSTKSDTINCAADRAEFDRRRRNRWDDPTASGWCWWRELIESHGKKLVCPYRDPAVFEWFMKHSWAELNRPRQKQAAVDAFCEEFKELAIYRRNDNLQCGSGVREWHDVLLTTSLNKQQRTRVQDLYGDVLNES